MAQMYSRYLFHNPEEIFEVARHLAQEFPDSGNVMIGIHELLLNAVEHGNLEMNSENKAILLQRGSFGKEIERLLASPENQDKFVEIESCQDECFTRLSIADQGKGFDWNAHVEPSGQSKQAHGRGLLLAMLCGFDAVSFNEKGNRVTCYSRNISDCIPIHCNYSANAPACNKIRCPRRPIAEE